METDIRAIQLKELEILKAVAEVCERHGLRYFLDGGTCLGAVRHQGFIPWDDDIDVGMPRQDYEKFRAVAPEELAPHHIGVVDSEKTVHNHRMFLKVHDTRTTFISPSEVMPDMWHGINIDIFPYDGYPADRWEAWRMRKELRVLWRVDYARRCPLPDRKPIDKLKRGVAAVIKLVFPHDWPHNRRTKLFTRYAPEACERSFMEVFGDLYIYPSDCILRTEKMPFEDAQFPCPADYETYLTIHYGDWRKLPPEEKRVAKHNGIHISLDKSYLDRWWEEKKA